MQLADIFSWQYVSNPFKDLIHALRGHLVWSRMANTKSTLLAVFLCTNSVYGRGSRTSPAEPFGSCNVVLYGRHRRRGSPMAPWLIAVPMRWTELTLIRLLSGFASQPTGRCVGCDQGLNQSASTIWSKASRANSSIWSTWIFINL